MRRRRQPRTRRRSRSKGISSTGCSAIRTAPSRSNTMVAPADQVVNERVKGLDFDVIHSWWVPDLGGKLDAIPGRVNKTWFKAPAGNYVARCAELCGIQHAHMDGTVRVVPRAQYDAFIAQRHANSTGPELGQEEWSACQSCHRLDHAYIGPALGGNPLLSDVNGPDDLAPQRSGPDAGGRQELDQRPDRGARRVHQAPAEGRRLLGGRQRRQRPAVSRRLAARPVRVVVDDRRPQAHRADVHLDVAHLLRIRRDPRAGHAHAARDAERAHSSRKARTTRC